MLSTALSGCVASKNEIRPFVQGQTKDAVRESAWFYLEGETSCLAVYRKSAQESESFIYRYENDGEVVWVKTEIAGSASFSTNADNKDYGIIKIVRGEGCQDYFAIGSIYSERKTIPDISDNFKSTYYVTCTTADHPEYKTQIYDVYSVMADIDGLEIVINGNTLKVK